jgi:hypothetical protein
MWLSSCSKARPFYYEHPFSNGVLDVSSSATSNLIVHHCDQRNNPWLVEPSSLVKGQGGSRCLFIKFRALKKMIEFFNGTLWIHVLLFRTGCTMFSKYGVAPRVHCGSLSANISQGTILAFGRLPYDWLVFFLEMWRLLYHDIKVLLSDGE